MCCQDREPPTVLLLCIRDWRPLFIWDLNLLLMNVDFVSCWFRSHGIKGVKTKKVVETFEQVNVGHVIKNGASVFQKFQRQRAEYEAGPSDSTGKNHCKTFPPRCKCMLYLCVKLEMTHEPQILFLYNWINMVENWDSKLYSGVSISWNSVWSHSNLKPMSIL